MPPLALAARTGILAALAAAAAAGIGAAASAQTPPRYSLTLYDQPDYRGGSVTLYGDNANIGSTGFATRARSAQVRGTWRLCEGGGYRNRCEVIGANVRDLGAYGLAGRVGSAQLVSGAAAPASRYERPYEPYAGPAPYLPAPYAAQPYPAQPYPPQPYGAPAGPSAPSPYDRRDDTPPAVDAPDYRAGDRYAPPASTQPPYGGDEYGADRTEGRTVVFFPEPRIRGGEVSAWTGRAADGFCRAQGLGTAVYFDQSQRSPRAVDLDGRPVGEGPVLRDVLCRRY